MWGKGWRMGFIDFYVKSRYGAIDKGNVMFGLRLLIVIWKKVAYSFQFTL